ncbi:glycosyltransferase family 2 protein [Bogoriella caseilytica]|uniref:Glycosyltransferase involved in cell wall biosynthesis n=1 Tax=Bogoriella caseilytica TaxID=56055 RepID=A0A3N2BE75_9MICO|nr:glycosyltransferase family 2 protein [Bogoriella caseilytica]ROR73344.1 glycosyltransferase involved in cell wall biosynthesis [Bogoriella caseilytica]
MPSPTDAPLVSIVMPCRNAETFVEDAIHQACHQTLLDIEIIVVDDGSTDGTYDKALFLAAKDPRVRAIPVRPGGGVARAREVGVREARGQWIWFVDVDDQWPATALSDFLSHSDGADVVVASARYVYADRSPRWIRPPARREADGRDAFGMLLAGALKGHLWNKLFRKDLIEGVSFTPSPVHSDLAMVGEALSAAHRVRLVDAHVYDYRVRPGSIITAGSPRYASLSMVAGVIDDCARRFPDDPGIAARHLYFQHRFILLSQLKDVHNASYSAPERDAMIATIRQDLTWKGVVRLARRRDLRRAVIAGAAKASRPLAMELGRRLANR